MPKKPLQALVATELSKLGVPPETQLQQPAMVSGTISKIITQDTEINAFHHKMVHYGICFRYAFALALSANKKAFAAYAQDKRIKGLARPPKNAADTLVSLCNATYADPKKASKYFKRIEHLWVKRTPVKAVSAFLKKHGLSDPPSKALPTPHGPPPPSSDKNTAGAKESVGNSKMAAGSVHQKYKPADVIDPNDPPGGAIGLWPGSPKTGETYKLIVKVHDAKDTEWVSIELIDLPELIG